MAEGNYSQRRGGSSGRSQQKRGSSRPRGGRGGGGRGGRSGRRPLLTSAINAAGLSLVALVALRPDDPAHTDVQCLLAMCVTLFGMSSLVSYFAQRSKAAWVEKVSDVFFLFGGALIVWIGLLYSGVLSTVGM